MKGERVLTVSRCDEPCQQFQGVRDEVEEWNHIFAVQVQSWFLCCINAEAIRIVLHCMAMMLLAVCMQLKDIEPKT